MGAALRTRLFCFGFRSLPKGLVRPLRLDLLTHLSTADPVEYEQADRRGQVSPLARLVDLCNRLRHRCTLGLCDNFKMLQNASSRETPVWRPSITTERLVAGDFLCPLRRIDMASPII
jgi:hypothetical protein